MMYIHFLRPWWFIAILPIILLFWRVYRMNFGHTAWEAICDRHLLKYLLQNNITMKRNHALLCLFASTVFLIISLMGPCWSKHFVPTYNAIDPHVLILDMSDNMLENDVKPNRLIRAKFKLHDLFNENHTSQFGLIVFTAEPFIISPLTSDAKTIDALLSSITTDIMPVSGCNLALALDEAAKLIHNAGLNYGEVLVLTAIPPDGAAIDAVKQLYKQKINTSILPVLSNENDSQFSYFAKQGHGHVLKLADDIKNWKQKHLIDYQLDNNKIIIWNDEGLWFLIPALILLLPAFRRNWLQRISL